MPDTLLSVVMIKSGTDAVKNGTASCTCVLSSADVIPSMIPHAASAATGIIRLLPKSEKNFIILLFIYFTHPYPKVFHAIHYFNSGHIPLFASIRASRIFLATLASLIRRLSVNASSAF